MNVNPIISMLNQTSNPYIKAFQAIRSSNNPEQALAQYLQNSQEGQQVMAYIQQNGGNAREALFKYAKDNGIDPNGALNMLRQ